jgi:hypothetical protein
MSKSTADSVFDVFISYAGEDRDAIARPLAEALRARGVSVWFDDYALAAGDKLKAAITAGVRNARYGVVIISKSYLAKDWPRLELISLWMHEGRIKRTVVLPVLHEISVQEVVAIEPAFEDRSMPSTDRGLDYVVDRVTAVIRTQDGADVRPIGHVAENASWWSILRGLLSMPLEVAEIAPRFRSVLGGLKVAVAYHAGFLAVIVTEAVVFALDWRLVLAEGRVLLHDATRASYLTGEAAILVMIYLWVRSVWWLRKRTLATMLMFSVLYAVAARLVSIPLSTIVISQAFPNRTLMLHACLGGVVGSGLILLLFWLGKVLLALVTRVANRRMEVAG